jgi:(2R)-sulfolactate sulfo-lyase subunit alpha
VRDFIAHHRSDNVGVAVVDIPRGHTARGEFLDGGSVGEIVAGETIPLGHKIALRDFSPGDTVIKYGEDIGKAVAKIQKGAHVHVHNLKTKRW